jgi:hypothetical protein
MLVRLLLSAAILTVPFGVLAMLSGKAEGLVWLMIPFIALVPIFLVAAVILFIPIEKLGMAYGWSPLPGLLTAGSALGALVAFLAVYFGNKKSVVLAEIAAGDLKVIGSLGGLVMLGAAMGAVWHYSQRVAEHFGLN